MHDEVFFLQIFNLSLQILFISLLMYQVTTSSIATSTSMERLRATLLLVTYVISMFKVMELILLMNINRFLMGWTDLMWS